MERSDKEEGRERLLHPTDGAGPLLERDYWAVIRDCRLTCQEIAALVRERFEAFPPEKLVTFHRRGEKEGPLEVGDELDVHIRMAADTAVRVVHADANSLTLATLQGHPEAGRITFGAYRNERGDVIFHIRSRARSSTSTHFAGFVMAGEPMQTTTWTDFIDRLAHSVGEGVHSAIWEESRIIDGPDQETLDAPTFIARGE